jgi:hypothetical protein
MKGTIISPRNTDSAIDKKELSRQLTIVSDYIKDRLKYCKGMDENECRRVIEALEEICSE